MFCSRLKSEGASAMQRTVLVIDYHSDIAEMLALALSMEKYVVKIARKKDQEVQLLQADPAIGCILIDGRTPDMPYSQFLKEVRRIRPDIPVILLTDEKGQKEQVNEAGLRCITSDPYDITHLEEVLDQCGTWSVGAEHG
jgi:DNA-binding NtrC family response regulator